MQKGFFCCVRRYPRKAPKAIASGISFRDGDLGSAKAVELIKVCDFYESKASGELCELAKAGDIERVQLLLDCSCDCNAADCQ